VNAFIFETIDGFYRVDRCVDNANFLRI